MKRIFDFIVSFVLLILLSPILVVSTLLTLTVLGWPVFFVQNRPGLDGRPFRMIKLRTMSNARDCDGRLLPDEERLGRLSRFMRSTSIDELPELLNVLRGDMSLVGPRPLLMEYLPLYTAEQARRHEVRPGITGWAQIKGRNSLSWEDKFALDKWYVENHSMRLDLKVLILTVAKVLLRQGISQGSHATMPVFRGNGRQP